jgi:TPR repeat protein
MYNKAHLLFKMARATESLFDRESYMFECLHWLRVCLDESDHLMDAHFLMGFFYEKGIQVDTNLSQAFEHY